MQTQRRPLQFLCSWHWTQRSEEPFLLKRLPHPVPHPAGHNEDEAAGSYEFLVYWTILQAVAADVGLVPVTDWGRDPELMSSFETVSTSQRHLNVHTQGWSCLCGR